MDIFIIFNSREFECTGYDLDDQEKVDRKICRERPNSRGPVSNDIYSNLARQAGQAAKAVVKKVAKKAIAKAIAKSIGFVSLSILF